MLLDRDRVFDACATTAAVLAAFAIRKGLQSAYRRVTGEEPPDNPASDEVSWRSALVWSALAGAGMGMGRMTARRTTAAGWKAVTGSSAPID